MPEEMRDLSTWVSTLQTKFNKKIPLHITRFFPAFNYTASEPTPVTTVMSLVEVAKEKLEYVFTGNV